MLSVTERNWEGGGLIGRGDAMKDERQRKRVSPKPVSYIRRITFDYFSRILEKRIYWKDWKILIFEQGREKLYTIRVQSPIFSRILEENISCLLYTSDAADE